LKAATMVGCEFCIDIGSEYARRSGLSDDQLLAVHDARDSGLFADDELLVIDLAIAMTRTPGDVGDGLMEKVVDHLGAKGTLELVHLIAWENTRARANVALGIGAAGFSDGKVCALPAPEAALAAASGD
jgi:4-carboxymuconolactone decarboxylase